MADLLGYVVIVYNQASHQPDVLDGSFVVDYGLGTAREMAEETAAEERLKTALIGRGERYAVAEVIELGDDHD